MPRQVKLSRPAEPRLGLHLRPGRNDRTTILRLLAVNRAVSGPMLEGWHQTLDAIGTTGLPVPLPALGYRVDVARPKPQSR